MTRLTIKKILLSLGIVYLLFGIFLIAQNQSLLGLVSRRQYPDYCQVLQATDINLVVSNPECINTDDLRTVFRWNLVQWRFLSDNRGYDQTRYIPVDLLATLVVITILGVQVRRKNDQA